ncbi:MAG: hypothetical protein AMXMBFR84_30940 [Candidatus Hydrogenedentota bacterium]
MGAAMSESAWQKRLRLEEGHRITHRQRTGGGIRAYLNSPALKRIALVAALRFTGLMTRARREADSPRLLEIEFVLPRLPRAFQGFRILHLSDFHIDGRPGQAETIRALLDPLAYDICVLTGDYDFDYYINNAVVIDAMRHILSAVRSPMIGILGNHDDSDLVEPLRQMGVKMLLNQSTYIERDGNRIWFAGVDDPHHYQCDDVESALSDIPLDAFTIFLAHSPERIESAAARHVDLYLCGHTHGGQLVLPGIGAVYNNARCPRKYMAGVWECNGMRGFTTNGLGCVYYPVRLNCPPEAAIVTLR